MNAKVIGAVALATVMGSHATSQAQTITYNTPVPPLVPGESINLSSLITPHPDPGAIAGQITIFGSPDYSVSGALAINDHYGAGLWGSLPAGYTIGPSYTGVTITENRGVTGPLTIGGGTYDFYTSSNGTVWQSPGTPEVWGISIPGATQPIPVNIYADAFIPSATLGNPGCISGVCLPGAGNYPTFAGDNRGISPTPGASFRIAQAITINASPGASPVISTWSDTGVTTGYDAAGQPHEGKASTSGLTETATENANGVTVQLEGSAGNPLVPASVFGKIGQQYTINISPVGNDTISYSVTGATKYFPGYELYIGGQLVYGYNPDSIGKGPSSLLNPFLTNTVVASGVISDSVAASDGPGSTSYFALQPTSSSTTGAVTTFAFDNVQSGSWFDPVSASTFTYTMLSDSDFTEILGFPSGFKAFEVFVGGVDEGSFVSGDTFEFPTGTTSFAIRGISPLGEPFPLQLAFNTPTGSFDVTVASVPEPSTWAMMLLGFAFLGYAGYRRTSAPRIA
jgi:hypothetical protein